MEKYLVILCLLLSSGGAVEGLKAYEIALEFLIRFHSKAALNLVANSTAHERRRPYQANLHSEKREIDVYMDSLSNDEELDGRLNINSPIYKTNVYNIPVDSFIKHAMMAILGEDGVLQKGGFYMDGYIKKDGTAFIKMSRSFKNRKKFVKLINKARKEAPGPSPLNVIVHFLLTKSDTNNLISWQKAQIQKGNIKEDDPCAPKLVIMYKCCTRTILPFIGPEFGSLMVVTD